MILPKILLRCVLLACMAALSPGLNAQGLPVRSGGRLLPDPEFVARLATLTLPATPDWTAANSGTLWTVDEMREEFRKVTDTPPLVHFVRTRFLRPDQAWTASYTGWFRKLEEPLAIRFVPNLWDCDDYARLYVTFADLLAMRAGETRAPVCVGWASVFQRNGFGGVGAGGRHAVVIIGTAQGFHVIEPQSGAMVPLRRYPNRHTIEAVYF